MSNEDRLVEALRWISGACDVGTNNCRGCGRPTGVLAIKSHADRALAAHEASKGEVSDAEVHAACVAYENSPRTVSGTQCGRDCEASEIGMRAAIEAFIAARKEKNDG